MRNIQLQCFSVTPFRNCVDAIISNNYLHFMKPEKLTYPHDRFFKESMEHIDIGQGLSKLLLPERISFKLDYSSLRIEKDSWINTMLNPSCG